MIPKDVAASYSAFVLSRKFGDYFEYTRAIETPYFGDLVVEPGEGNSMKAVHVALALCVLLSSGRVDAEEHPTTFRLFACEVRAEYVSLVFTRGRGGHSGRVAEHSL